jgi:hypothetical protein
MDAREKNTRWTALRAEIQTGGIWVGLVFASGRWPHDGGILTARARHGQMRCFDASKKSSSCAAEPARRGLMLKGLFNGHYWEDRR